MRQKSCKIEIISKQLVLKATVTMLLPSLSLKNKTQSNESAFDNKGSLRFRQLKFDEGLSLLKDNYFFLAFEQLINEEVCYTIF